MAQRDVYCDPYSHGHVLSRFGTVQAPTPAAVMTPRRRPSSGLNGDVGAGSERGPDSRGACRAAPAATGSDSGRGTGRRQARDCTGAAVASHASAVSSNAAAASAFNIVGGASAAFVACGSPAAGATAPSGGMRQPEVQADDTSPPSSKVAADDEDRPKCAWELAPFANG
jgi:hypothetical protein